MLLPITNNQEQVFSKILNYIEHKNYPPTICELQEELCINNPGAVHKCLTALENKGYITREKRKHRGLDLTSEAKEIYLQ